MIRFKLVVGFVLLGSPMVTPMTMGQDPPIAREDPTATTKFVADQSSAVIEGLYNSIYQVNGRGMAANQDVLETNFGLSLAEADDALRTQLAIPPGEGVVVVAVKPGSLAEQAGMKVNDVLLSLGEEKVGEALKARKILLGLGKEALEVKLIREGKPRRMSLVGPEHGFPAEAAEYWIGVPVSPVDSTLRAHLPSLAAETGLIVNDVVKASPAETAGVHKSDILVTMNGKPLKSSDGLIEQIQASAGKPAPLEILRAGKPLTITVTPAKRAHPTTIKVISSTANRFYQLHQPFVGNQALNPPEASQNLYGVPLNLELMLKGSPPSRPENSTARVEVQLKEMSVKLDEIRKILDGMQKLDRK